MRVQIITFGLHDLSDAEYRRLCDGWAAGVAALEGLYSKLWLADPETNTYGGVLVWRDMAAMEAARNSELMHGVATHPQLIGFEARHFGVLEGPSGVTHGLPGHLRAAGVGGGAALERS